jgi:hypothetical protein
LFGPSQKGTICSSEQCKNNNMNKMSASGGGGDE